MPIHTVGDLLDHLDGLDPDTPVRLAVQPTYPFEHEVGAVVIVDDVIADGEAGAVVYLSDGGQIDYLRGTVRAALGW